MNTLSQLLKDHPRERMLFMRAIANRCDKVIEMTFKDDYTKEIAKHVASTKLNLTEKDKEMFSKLISDAINHAQLKDVQEMEEKIIAFDKSIERVISHECRIALEEFIELSEISRVDAISAEDAKCLITWMIISDILSEHPLCKDSLYEASSYKKQNKKETKKTKKEKLPNNTEKEHVDSSGLNKSSTPGIYRAIYDGTQSTFNYRGLTESSKKFVDSMTDYLLREYESAKTSMKNGKYLMEVSSPDLKSKVSPLEKIFQDITYDGEYALSTTDRSALIYDHVQSGGTMDENMAMVAILYSEVMYCAGESMNRNEDKKNITLQILRLPVVYNMLNDDISKITIESVMRDLNTLWKKETIINKFILPHQKILDKVDELVSIIPAKHVAS